MQTITNMAPLTIGDQARLLDIPVSQIRRIYRGATNVPVTALEKTVWLQRNWETLQENDALTGYADPEAESVQLNNRLGDLLLSINTKQIRLQLQALSIERRAGSLPGQLLLVQLLATTEPEDLVNKRECELIKWKLEEKINSSGYNRLPAIASELAILGIMEQLLQEQLKNR